MSITMQDIATLDVVGMSDSMLQPIKRIVYFHGKAPRVIRDGFDSSRRRMTLSQREMEAWAALRNTKFPPILFLETILVRFSIGDVVATGKDDDVTYQRYIYDARGRVVGELLVTPSQQNEAGIHEGSEEADFLTLSWNRPRFPVDRIAQEYQFRHVSKENWIFANVMLIKWDHSRGFAMARRVALGKIILTAWLGVKQNKVHVMLA
jgi:hypothetical protein